MSLSLNLAKLKQIPTDERKECIILLDTMLSKILKYPMEQKYQRFDMKIISEKFKKCPLCIEILYNAGFVKSKNCKKIIFNYSNMRTLKRTSKSLQKMFKKETTIQIKYETNDVKQLQKFAEISQQHNQNEFDKDKYYINSSYLLENQRTSGKCDLSSCSAMREIAGILAKYKSFTHEEKKSSENNVRDIEKIFTDKCNDVFILNAFHHLLEVHSNQFEEIYNELNSQNEICVKNKCYCLRRNYRDRSSFKENSAALEKMYFGHETNGIVKQQILDKIHCYFSHAFDIGHRITKNERLIIENAINNDEFKENNIITQDEIVMAIGQLSAVKKQTLEILNAENTKFLTESKDEDMTYIFGIRFFYWDFCRDNHEIVDPVRFWSPHIGTGYPIPANDGYTLGDLYVAAKFKDLKQELTSNSICTINMTQFNNLAQKAKVHHQTNVTKNKICICRKPREYYGFASDPKMPMISSSHYAAVLGYCNYDILQRLFSQTCRRIPKNESNSSLIQRHSNFAILARLLRECVECFAEEMYTEEFHRHFSFFHGIDFQYQFNSVEAVIKTPLSTTTDFAVAVNFCGNKGVILNLHLGEGWSTTYTDAPALFDCKFISDYTSEQEIFFIGGYGNFTFLTIITASGQNYIWYVYALTFITNTMATRWDNRAISEISNDDMTHMRVLKQMCFRILSHELHIHFPDDDKYFEFKSIPKYA
eukprot:74961_1